MGAFWHSVRIGVVANARSWDEAAAVGPENPGQCKGKSMDNVATRGKCPISFIIVLVCDSDVW
jgi:hypothetical protein